MVGGGVVVAGAERKPEVELGGVVGRAHAEHNFRPLVVGVNLAQACRGLAVSRPCAEGLCRGPYRRRYRRSLPHRQAVEGVGSYNKLVFFVGYIFKDRSRINIVAQHNKVEQLLIVAVHKVQSAGLLIILKLVDCLPRGYRCRSQRRLYSCVAGLPARPAVLERVLPYAYIVKPV